MKISTYCCEIVSKEKKSNGEISNSRYFIAKGGWGGGKPISRPKYGYHGQTYEAKYDHIHMNIFQNYNLNIYVNLIHQSLVLSPDIFPYLHPKS